MKLLAFLFASLLFVSCGAPDEDESAESATERVAADGFQIAEGEGVSFEVPADWFIFKKGDDLTKLLDNSSEERQAIFEDSGMDIAQLELAVQQLAFQALGEDGTSVNLIAQSAPGVDIQTVSAMTKPQLEGAGAKIISDEFVDSSLGESWRLEYILDSQGVAVNLEAASFIVDGDLIVITAGSPGGIEEANEILDHVYETIEAE